MLLSIVQGGHSSVADLVLEVSGNQTAYNVLTAATAAGYNAATDDTAIIVNIQSGVDIVGSSGNPGIQVGAINSASDLTINIASGASVCGFDGANNTSTGGAGGDGTDAISFSGLSSSTATLSVVSSGTLGGGSGGGGGGGSGGSAGARLTPYCDSKGCNCFSPNVYGSAGSKGANGSGGTSCQAQNGTAGATGSSGSYPSNVCPVSVGAGSGGAGGAGGTAGKAIEYNSLTVNFTNNGTLYGATS